MSYSAGSVMVDIGGNTAGFDKALSGVLGGLGTLKNVALGAGVAVAAALGGIAYVGVKSFADFDAAMTKSLAIMGDIDDGMRNRLATAAREMAKETKFSAVEAAEALYFLSSSGLDAEQVIRALGPAAAFAQAGMFDLDTATQLLTSSQQALGLKSADAAKNMENMIRVSDVLVQADNEANASVREFAEALSVAGGRLRITNKEVEEGVAVLMAFSSQGLRGAEAGQALEMVLRDLQGAQRRSADAWKDLGISVYDAAGKMRPTADIIGDLEKALSGMSDQQKNATLAALGFQERSLKYILALLGMSDAIRDYEAALKSAGGITEEVAAKQLMTFNERLGLLKDKFKDVAMSIGEALMPHLERLVAWLDRNSDAIATVLVRVFEAIAWVVGKAVTALEIFAGVCRAVFSDDTASRVEGLQVVIDNFGLAGLVVVTKLRESWEAFKAHVLRVIDIVGPAIERFVEVIGPIIAQLVGAFAGGWAEVESETGSTFERILRFIESTLTFICDKIIIPILNAIQRFWDAHGEEVLKIVHQFGKFLSENFDTIMTVLMGILSIATSIMEGDWEGAWNTIKDIGGRIWAQIVSNMDTILNIAACLVVQVGLAILRGIISNAWEGIKTVVKDKLGEILSEIKTKVLGWVFAAGNALLGLPETIAAPFRRAYDVVSGWVSKIRSAISKLNPFSKASPAPAEVILAGWDALNKALEKTLDYNLHTTVTHVGDYRSAITTGLSPSATPSGPTNNTTYNITIHASGAAAGEAAGDAFIKRLTVAGVLI